MMRDFLNLRGCLEALAKNGDVLPATGGAAEQLLQPDLEEREDAAIVGDGISDRFAEDPAPRTMKEFIPCPQVPRTEINRYRYFLDGAMRTHYLCTVSEQNVTEPVLLGEVGAAVMERLDDGSLRPFAVKSKLLLLINKQPFSQALTYALDQAAEASRLPVIDTGQENAFTRRSAADPAARAQGCARWEMRELERCILQEIPAGDYWMITDGSLSSQGSRQAILKGQQVIGVAKSFAKSPKFRAGRSTETITVTRLVAELPVGHRTPLFVSSQGDTGFWYVRLWPQGAVDYPLMGVIKCDIELPSQIPVIQGQLATDLSGSLVAERRVTPLGNDPRWHSQLYPIHIAEQVIRSRFIPPLMLREGLTREWSRLLRGGK